MIETANKMKNRIPRVRIKFGTIAWCMFLVVLIYFVISFTVEHNPDRISRTEAVFYRKTKPLQNTNEDFLNKPVKNSKHESDTSVNKINEAFVNNHGKKSENNKRKIEIDETEHFAVKGVNEGNVATKSEITHVVLLKVHKTASSTAQNVFLRFGDSRNLTFILAHTKGESGWLNVISYHNSITKTNIVPAPPGRHFDILCNHVIYNRKSFDAVLPKDTVYIGIVREPMSRFQSAVKYFNPNFILKLPGPKPLIEYSNNPLKYESPIPRNSQTNNRMAVEFGFPEELFPGKSLSGSPSEIKKYLNKLEGEFKLIIISERFDESMVLMKRYLNWGTKDVLYVDKNVASSATNPRKLVSDEAKENLKSFLYLDIALYKFALDRFNRQIQAEGNDFTREYTTFISIREKVIKFCKSKSMSLTIEKTEWDESFTVTQHDCKMYNRHEKDLLQKQRLRMYGTYDN